MALVMAVVAFFAPVVLLGRTFFLRDAQLAYYPTRLLLRRRLLQGDLPLWLPELDLGMPFLAYPANGVLYPGNVLLLLPEPHGVSVFIVAHVVLGAVGTLGLLRELRTSPEAAVVGALAFALGGYTVGMTWVPGYTVSLGWMPVVAWSVLAAIRTGLPGAAALAGIPVALQLLAGEPQGTALALALSSVLALARPSSRRGRLRALGLLVIAAAVAVAVAMPQLLPTAELLPRSRRAGGVVLTEAQHWSLHPLRLAELVVPGLFGSPLEHRTFLGYFLNDEGGPVHRDPWMVSPYLGTIPLAFATLAMFAPRRRHRWWVRVVALGTAIVVLLALGRHTPVYGVYYLLPGAKLFRYPAKFWGVVALTVPLLAAAGVDAWLKEPRCRRTFRTVALGLLTVLALALVTSPWLSAWLARQRPDAAATASATVGWAVASELIVTAALLGALVLLRRGGSPWLAALLPAAVAGQLFRANLDAYQSVSADVYTARPALARAIVDATPANALPRTVHQVDRLAIPGLEAMAGPERSARLAAGLLRNTGILHGLEHARAYQSAGEGRKRAFWDTTTDPKSTADLLGVRFLVLPEGVSPPAARRVPGPPGTGVVVWRSTSARPFAYPVRQGLPARAREDVLRQVLSPTIVGGDAALLEGAPVIPPDPPLGGDGCRPLGPLGDTLRVRCRLASPRWVVVNETHHPGFRATVDGRPVPLYRANGFVIAARLPAGTPTLELTYTEAGLLPGAVVGALGLLIALGLVLRDRRRPSPPVAVE